MFKLDRIRVCLTLGMTSHPNEILRGYHFFLGVVHLKQWHAFVFFDHTQEHTQIHPLWHNLLQIRNVKRSKQRNRLHAKDVSWGIRNSTREN